MAGISVTLTVSLVCAPGCASHEPTATRPLASASDIQGGGTATSASASMASPTSPSLEPVAIVSGPPAKVTPELARKGGAVLAALKKVDCHALAKLIHPERGVMFTPYASNGPDQGKAATRATICQLLSDSSKVDWGLREESEDRVLLPPREYFARYVNDRDYEHAPEKASSSIERATWNPDMLDEDFPGSMFIDYHFPSSEAGGLDWGSLFLIFERLRGELFLVGVVHHTWTP